jgi:lycopene cyclase domain-containing protein
MRFDKIKIVALDSKNALVILSSMAFIYTTPWDNYLVAQGVWFYDEALVSGIIIYWVPLEEYLFFILETILVGLLFLNINTINTNKILNNTQQKFENINLRIFGFSIVIVLWSISLILLLSGYTQFTYVALIMVWALIPIGIQIIYGVDLIWDNIIPISVSITISTIYLSFVDAYAIRSGTWTIDSEYSLASFKLDILPFEEILFFLITSILVTFGTFLATNYHSRIRFYLILEAIKTKRQKPPLING